ncbi:Vacuolar protein sorting-associated protein 8 [Entophlyctis luteolus]|nr:Vacuolar protein sorting-associated protein 8 [Entophlyctis luteolus]
MICVWDVGKKLLIKTINPTSGTTYGAPDRIPQQRGHHNLSKIVHLSFVGSNLDLISADDEGTAFYHTISTIMRFSTHTVSTQLSGKQPIYRMQALPRAQRAHVSDKARIVAVMTPMRLMLMRLRPTPAVIRKISMREFGASVPATCAALAWQPVLIGKEIASASEPVLAASFNKMLMIFKVVERISTEENKGKADLHIVYVGKWLCDEDIVAIHWISPMFLCLLTNEENLIVLDSQRLFIVMIQGLNSFQMASIMNWNDRLSSLVKAGDSKAAINMAAEFYQGQSNRVVSGLPSDSLARQKVVGAYLTQILLTYVSLSLSSAEFEISHQDYSYSRDLAATCFYVCLLIQDEDLLFGEIFEGFSESGLSNAFFDELEDHVLKEKFSTKLDRPVVIQGLVEYFSSQSLYKRLEQVLLHMNPSAMDINKVLRICETNALYPALIFVYNNALRDFVTPIVIMMSAFEDSIALRNTGMETRNPTDSSYIAYVYLAYILTGKAFPVGILTRRDALQAKSDLYNFLFSASHTSWPPDSSSGMADANGKNGYQSRFCALGVEPYPYIRLLLQSDARELFNVLTLAFEDSCLDGEIRLRDGHAQDGRVRFADMYVEVNRQFVVDTMLIIAHSEVPDSSWNLSEADLILLHVFLAKVYGKYGEQRQISSNGDSNGVSLGLPLKPAVVMSTQTSRELFQTLLLCQDESSREERQAALIAMLGVFNPAVSHSERESVVASCRRMSFWRLAEKLYRQWNQFEMLLECYLNDESRRRDVFSCISDLLLGGTLEYSQTYVVRQHVLESLPQLIAVDPVETAALIVNIFPADSENVMIRLQQEPKSQYLYLRGILEYEARLDTVSSGLKKQRSSLLSTDSKMLKPVLTGGNKDSKFSMEMYHTFIRLMLMFAPDEVVQFLMSTARHCDEAQIESNPYEYEVVLGYCLERNVKPPALWILERTGQILRALRIALEDFTSNAAICVAIVREELNLHRSPSEMDIYSNPFAGRTESFNQKRVELHLGIQDMNRSFGFALGICERKCGSLDKWESDSIWFQLLDSVMEKHGEVRAAVGTPCYDIVNTDEGCRTPTTASGGIGSQLINALRFLIRRALKGMVRYVSLSSVLLRLLDATDEARFGELRRAIFIMFEEYAYERRLMSAARRIICRDAHIIHNRLVMAQRRGVRPVKGQCGVCRRLLHIEIACERTEEISDSFVAFECHHIFHERCLKAEVRSAGNPEIVSVLGSDGYWCVVCEDLNENGVRQFKREVLNRAYEVMGKGKMPEMGFQEKLVDSDVFPAEGPVDLDRIYKIFDLYPTPDMVYSAFSTRGRELEEDHVSLNEGYDDTDTSTSATSKSVSRRQAVPRKVAKMLGSVSTRVGLLLEPPVPDS